MERIILHWTGGAHQPSQTDLRHYHYVIDGAGAVHEGVFAPKANAGPLRAGGYAAHTRGANTGAIGVALAAMGRAVERPFKPGPWPITPAQVDALVVLVARLCREHGISVTPRGVLTHAEVAQVLGAAQLGKWDISWLPGAVAPQGAAAVGGELRARVARALAGEMAVQGVWWRRLLAVFVAKMGGAL